MKLILLTYMKSRGTKECFANCTVHVMTILMVMMLIAIMYKRLIPLLFGRQLGHVKKAQGTSGEVSTLEIPNHAKASEKESS